jgi:hypothetical protein
MEEGQAKSEGGLSAELNTKQQLALWYKPEKITMHFNELLIRLRTQAFGAVATIVTAAGFLASRGSTML